MKRTNPLNVTEKLFEAIKDYPLLFDFNHEDYRDSRKKERTWRLIGEKLNEDGKRLKKKWKNLRDSYAKYLKCNNTKTGKDSKKDNPKWQWASHMEGFRPFLNISPTSNTICLNNDPAPTNSPERGGSNREEPKETVQSQELPETTTTTIDTTTSSSVSRKAPRRRKPQAPEECSSVGSVLDYLKNKRRRSMDGVDMIFRGYAQTLKQFSPRRQAEVKIKIATIMAEAEMLHNEEQLSSPSTSANSYELHPDTTVNYPNTSALNVKGQSSDNESIDIKEEITPLDSWDKF